MTNGLRTSNEPFFHQNPKLLNLDRKLGQINFAVFEVFSAELCFLLINHYFYKKKLKPLYPNSKCFGLEFEFGPQKIRDLAIVRP